MTTVDGPGAFQEVYTFDGWDAYDVPFDNEIWQVGLLKSVVRTDGLQTTTETRTYVEGDTLSTSNWQHSSSWVSCGSSRKRAAIKFVKPSQIQTVTQRDGGTYTTTLSNFDQYGNPDTITESGDATRTTTLDYWYSTPENILDGRLALRDQNPGSYETHIYSTKGQRTRTCLEDTNINCTTGLRTDFTYDGFGRLTKEVVENDSEDRERSYFDFAFGKPERDVINMNSVSDIEINRNINARGLVDWEEDGRDAAT